MSGADDYKFRLKWRRTFPEDGLRDDFSCYAGDQFAGRIIQYEHGPSQSLWRACGAHPRGFQGRPITPVSSTAETPREAARWVEEYWFAMLELVPADRRQDGD